MRVEGYRIHKWGGPLQWEPFDLAPPQRGEVLVRIEACGIGLTVLTVIALWPQRKASRAVNAAPLEKPDA